MGGRVTCMKKYVYVLLHRKLHGESSLEDFIIDQRLIKNTVLKT
jgi:hypothetical protein